MVTAHFPTMRHAFRIAEADADYSGHEGSDDTIVFTKMVLRMSNSNHFAGDSDMMLMALTSMMKAGDGKAKKIRTTTTKCQDYHDEDIPDTCGFVSSERGSRGVLGGSWVVVSWAPSQVARIITRIGGLITPLITPHELPSRVHN